jgi:hypothetical protein
MVSHVYLLEPLPGFNEEDAWLGVAYDMQNLGRTARRVDRNSQCPHTDVGPINEIPLYPIL